MLHFHQEQSTIIHFLRTQEHQLEGRGQEI